MQNIITKTEQSLTLALHTRNINYNAIKNDIASNYTTMGLNVVESTRTTTQRLGIAKSIVSRVLLQLEDEGFLTKESCGNHPKDIRYIVAASKQECWLYRNYYSLSPYRKKNFLKNLQTCGAKTLNEIVHICFGWGYDSQEYDRVVGS